MKLPLARLVIDFYWVILNFQFWFQLPIPASLISYNLQVPDYEVDVIPKQNVSYSARVWSRERQREQAQYQLNDEPGTLQIGVTGRSMGWTDILWWVISTPKKWANDKVRWSELMGKRGAASGWESAAKSGWESVAQQTGEKARRSEWVKKKPWQRVKA